MARIGRPPSIELVAGMQVGDWVLLEKVRKGRNYWRCRCACGAERDVVASDLTSATRSRSCGACGEFVNRPRVDRPKITTPAVNNIFALGESH